jgi:Rne/Rng family ribonuclease
VNSALPEEPILAEEEPEESNSALDESDELEAAGTLVLEAAASMDSEVEDSEDEGFGSAVAFALSEVSHPDPALEIGAALSDKAKSSGAADPPVVPGFSKRKDESTGEPVPLNTTSEVEELKAETALDAKASDSASSTLPLASSELAAEDSSAELEILRKPTAGAAETAERARPERTWDESANEIPSAATGTEPRAPELNSSNAAPANTQAIPPAAAPAGGPPSTKAQFRNSYGSPKFLRRNIDRRRRSNVEERGEGDSSPAYPLIGDLLKEGQEILVQIAKEPLGTKGARITSHIALPGRYLVYMPTVDHIGVSRKIESDEERQRLKRIIQENRRGNFPGGFIVRTAGQGKGEQEFKSDINFLYALWSEVKSRADKKRGASFVHRDLNLVQRILRDQLSADFSNIRVDNESEYAAIVEFINRFQPSLVSRVKLYSKDAPIFEEFGVQTEIDRALRNKVWLKSGGYIVIDQAEALVAIDINTGKYVGKSNKLEDTIVKTNIEAAKEIARQIRLRDLGGIIVCDFIDMEDRKNRLKVTQTLEEALRNDKAPSKILQFNDFGLVAITRKRVKQSLMRALCEPCTHCTGSGMIKSAQTVCYEIQGEAKRMAKTLESREITIRVNPEVAKTLKTTEISVIQEIESALKKDVVIKSDPLLHRERFDIF